MLANAARTFSGPPEAESARQSAAAIRNGLDLLGLRLSLADFHGHSAR
jgi:hypothetical protein